MGDGSNEADMEAEEEPTAPATGASRLNDFNDPDGALRGRLRAPYMGLDKTWSKDTHKYMAEFKHQPIVVQVTSPPACTRSCVSCV